MKEQDFVKAAKSNGATSLRQMVQYILPNALPPLFVTFSFSIASAILAESGLSFLGLGVRAVSYTHLDVYKRQVLYHIFAYLRKLAYQGSFVSSK